MLFADMPMASAAKARPIQVIAGGRPLRSICHLIGRPELPIERRRLERFNDDTVLTMML